MGYENYRYFLSYNLVPFYSEYFTYDKCRHSFLNFKYLLFQVPQRFRDVWKQSHRFPRACQKRTTYHCMLFAKTTFMKFVYPFIIFTAVIH